MPPPPPPGTTYAKLAWLQAWHSPRRKPTGQRWPIWSTPQFRHPFAEHWGRRHHIIGRRTARTSARDSKAESTAPHQPEIREQPRADVLHPHLRPVRAVPHQGRQRRRARLDLRARRPAVPWTNPTCGSKSTTLTRQASPNHVFALMHLLGFRFGAVSSATWADTPSSTSRRAMPPIDALKPMIGGTLNIKHVRAHWGPNPAAGPPRSSRAHGDGLADAQEGLAATRARTAWAVALRELGRIRAHGCFHPGLAAKRGTAPSRVHAGLNKGEARKRAGSRRCSFNRLGEIRDRSFSSSNSANRASGLNLVTAAIVLWNTVYLERAAHGLRGNGHRRR